MLTASRVKLVKTQPSVKLARIKCKVAETGIALLMSASNLTARALRATKRLLETLLLLHMACISGQALMNSKICTDIYALW